MSTPPVRLSRFASRPFRPAARSGQSGAAMVMTAAALLLLVPVLGLAINIGQLYYAQRDLETQATLAALSAVQIASGCANGGVPALQAAINSEVARVIDANNTGLSAGSSAVMTGINGSPAVEVGTINSTSGFRKFSPLTIGNENITAVRVNLTRPQPAPFLNLGAGSGAGALLYASATAEQPAYASFRIGTTTLSLNEGAVNSLLSGLLGTSVNLTAVGYQGLARARVTIGNLALAANVTSVNDLLNLDLTAPQALQIIATALSATGDATSGTAAGLISGIAGQSYSSTPVIQNVFGQMFNSAGAALNPPIKSVVGAIPFVDGLGLLTALGQAAAGTTGNSIQLPVTLSIPGLAGIGLFLKVIEPEQPSNLPGRPGRGPGSIPYTTAQSSQVRLQARINVSALALPLIRLALDVDVANGLAELLTVNCPSVTNPQPRATIQTTTSLITATVGTFTGSATANPPQDPKSGSVINVLFLVSIDATKMSNSLPGTTHSAQTASGPTFPVELPSLASSGNLTTLITSLLASSLDIKILGIGLNAGTLLAAILSPVTLLLDTLLNPLLSALGVSLGNAAVTVDSITTQRPQIVNTCLPGTANCQ